VEYAGIHRRHHPKLVEDSQVCKAFIVSLNITIVYRLKRKAISNDYSFHVQFPEVRLRIIFSNSKTARR